MREDGYGHRPRWSNITAVETAAARVGAALHGVPVRNFLRVRFKDKARQPNPASPARSGGNVVWGANVQPNPYVGVLRDEGKEGSAGRKDQLGRIASGGTSTAGSVDDNGDDDSAFDRLMSRRLQMTLHPLPPTYSHLTVCYESASQLIVGQADDATLQRTFRRTLYDAASAQTSLLAGTAKKAGTRKTEKDQDDEEDEGRKNPDGMLIAASEPTSHPRMPSQPPHGPMESPRPGSNTDGQGQVRVTPLNILVSVERKEMASGDEDGTAVARSGVDDLAEVRHWHETLMKLTPRDDLEVEV